MIAPNSPISIAAQPAPHHRTAGLLDLRFFCTAGTPSTTNLMINAQQPPLRVIRAFPLREGGVLTHLHNVSGGVLGGDQLTVSVRLEESTQVQLTSTGATRVYRHRPGYSDATQSTRIHVGENALLEYLPDQLIPFAGARYRQQTHITLAKNAGLFYWEVIAPGREAHDECFAYAEVNLHLDILATTECGDSRPLVFERICLQPTIRPLTSPARMGAYRYFGTFYICKVGVTAEEWRAVESELMGLANQLTHPGAIVWGVSTLPAHGLTVRALSMTNRAITEGFYLFWSRAKEVLYGRAAVLPRKVY